MQYKKLPSSCTFFRQKRGREHSEALNVCTTFFMLEMWCFMDHDGVFSPSSAMFCRAITFRVFFLCSEYLETRVSKVRLWCFYSFLKQRSFHLQSSASLCRAALYYVRMLYSSSAYLLHVYFYQQERGRGKLLEDQKHQNRRAKISLPETFVQSGQCAACVCKNILIALNHTDIFSYN